MRKRGKWEVDVSMVISCPDKSVIKKLCPSTPVLLFYQVTIPPEVQKEFGIYFSWLIVKIPQNKGMVNSLKLGVDDGEADVSWRATFQTNPVSRLFYKERLSTSGN